MVAVVAAESFFELVKFPAPPRPKEANPDPESASLSIWVPAASFWASMS